MRHYCLTASRRPVCAEVAVTGSHLRRCSRFAASRLAAAALLAPDLRALALKPLPFKTCSTRPSSGVAAFDHQPRQLLFRTCSTGNLLKLGCF